MRREWLIVLLIVVLLVPVGCGTTAEAQPGRSELTAQSGSASLTTASGTTTYYTVQSGDTLYSLARYHGTTVEDIVQTNNLSDPNYIHVGQGLTIPTGGTVSQKGEKVHVVQSGDTLYSLARYHGTTVEDIVQDNNLPDPNYIRVGQVLIIPTDGEETGPLPAPSNLGVKAISQSQINLSWTDNSSNEDGFKIERSPDGTSMWIQIDTIGTGAGVGGVISYYDTGRSCGMTYYYRVRTYNAGGDSGYSNTANATIACVPSAPAAPSNLGVKAVSQSQINLWWVDNSGNEDGFKIERSSTGTSDDWSPLPKVGANVTSYSNTGLNWGMTYHYRVRAYNAGGDSGYSNTANATTDACEPSALAAPSDLGVTVASQSQSSPTSKTYKVQSGDCLMGIARKLLGDPHRWREIANLNGIGPPYTLHPGQEIKVPEK